MEERWGAVTILTDTEGKVTMDDGSEMSIPVSDLGQFEIGGRVLVVGIGDKAPITRWGADVREQVDWALLNRATELIESGHNGDALSDYDEVIRHLEDPGDDPLADLGPAVREQMALALYGRGWVLRRLRRDHEALEAFTELIERFDTAEDETVQARVTDALREKVQLLLPSEPAVVAAYDQAIIVLEQLLERQPATTDPEALTSLAWALTNRGIAFEETGQTPEALSDWNDAITRFLDAPGAATREAILHALLHKAAVLDEETRIDEAIATHNQIQARYGADGDASISDLVVRARARRDYLVGRHHRAEQTE